MPTKLDVVRVTVHVYLSKNITLFADSSYRVFRIRRRSGDEGNIAFYWAFCVISGFWGINC